MDISFSPTRRAVTAGLGSLGVGAGLLTPSIAFAQNQGPLLAKPIPQGNGERLPVVGVGTVNVFDVGSGAKDRAGPTAVVRALVAGGGSLIDTAPSYGNAEAVVGDILAQTGLRPKAVIATKLERYRRGDLAAETRECLGRLKTGKIDILQLHNVRDGNQDMAELNGLKAQGLCRYTGITTTYEGSYAAAEAIIKRTKPEFLEIDYAIDNREAEQRVLPAARDAGTAVLIALPFGRGRLFRTALGKKLPDWAGEIDCASWGQFFLKFLVSHPAVTAVIPGTSNPEHMVDNLGAGHGKMPDAAMRARMIQYVESLG
jgi:aryl-alcohol dehydrogenase-like predicted oxidoreductase